MSTLNYQMKPSLDCGNAKEHSQSVKGAHNAHTMSKEMLESVRKAKVKHEKGKLKSLLKKH